VKLVVGLGNPGAEYARTPHNMGFRVVERLAERLGCRFRSSWRFQARTASGVHGGEDVLLVEPQTYMNNSGRAVSAVLNYRKLTPADLVVVLDDADLPFGFLRIRRKGSAGGHKGLLSIASAIGTQEFDRVRIGIGRGRREGDLIGHVLTAFSGKELESVEETTEQAVDALLLLIEKGAETAMNRFNSRQPETGKAGENGGGQTE